MQDRASNTETLKGYALELGLSLFGVADVGEARSGFLLRPETAAAFDSAVSLGLRVIDSVIEDIEDRPTALYFHHYRQLNFFLDRAALQVAYYIQDKGYSALPVAASQIIDWDRQQAHLSHKKIGLLAGLGWIGRNNLLVNPALGSRFRLVTVLTDFPLEKASPLEGDCGSCRDCMFVCPARAVRQDPGDFDHHACFEKLKEFRRAGIVSQFICGVCVKACRGPKP